MLSMAGAHARLGLIAYPLTVLGMAVDQLSTTIGLQQPNITETNPVALFLMDAGLWLPVDLALTLLSVVMAELLGRKRGLWQVTAFPLFYGVLRLLFGIHNVSLILFP